MTSKFKFMTAIVKKPDAITHGKTCKILKYNKKIRKYKVSFDNTWIGWYKRKELDIQHDKIN